MKTLMTAPCSGVVARLFAEADHLAAALRDNARDVELSVKV